MLIRERLEEGDFSNSERAIVDFILDRKQGIKDMTTKEIAQGAFASPSTLVRIARKMGFGGWNELKEAFLCGVYAVSNNLILAREFQHNMSRIGKKVELCQLQGETVYSAYMAERTSCALIISYSGETPVLVRGAEILKKHKIPVILITNIGESSLSKMADCVLRICTRERQYSKIATFTTDSSIAYLLDVLYSCLFVLDYEKNLQMKIDAGRVIELGRESTVEIIREQ